MITNATLRVGKDEDGARLDLFVLAHFASSSRALVRDALSRGLVELNGRKAPKGAKLHADDAVTIRELLEGTDIRVRPDSSVVPAIVYADDALLAADKPAGMPVQPLSPRETGTLMNGLAATFPELASVGDDPLIAGAVHRIDAGTSGLVVVARSNEIFAAMRRAFSKRKVTKTYLALVEGKVPGPGQVSCDLAHDPALPFCKMIKTRDGLHAETAFRPLHPAGANTLLEVTILTGVTHQIRAQLAMAGHPIVGDALYGAKSDFGDGTFRLHSLAAEFAHPATGLPLRLEAPRPAWGR